MSGGTLFTPTTVSGTQPFRGKKPYNFSKAETIIRPSYPLHCSFPASETAGYVRSLASCSESPDPSFTPAFYFFSFFVVGRVWPRETTGYESNYTVSQ